jgi:site-specific DNA recombinase
LAYVRVSSLPQQEKYSPSIQRRAIETYAASHGLVIVKTFEEARSGWQAKSRIDFYQMLKFAEDEKIKNILFFVVSRISRNIEDFQALKAAGLTLHNVSKNVAYSLSDKAHWRIFIDEQRELAEASKFSYENSERASTGMLEAARRGFYPGCLPLGYIRVSRDGKRSNEPEPERAPKILRLFEEFATDNHSSKGITRFARDIGLRSKRGKRLSYSTIQAMLRNRFYIGELPWKGFTFHGDHQPVIPASLFSDVQRVLQRRSNHKGREGKVFKYSRLLTCQLCGSAIVAEERRKKLKHSRKELKWTYYHCASHTGCPSAGKPWYKEEDLDFAFELLLKEIKDLNIGPDQIENFRRALASDYRATQKDATEELTALRQELAQVENAKIRATERYVEGSLKESEYRAFQNAKDQRLSEVRCRIADLELVVQDTIDLCVERIKFCNQLIEGYLRADILTRRKLHRLLFKTCTLAPRNVTTSGGRHGDNILQAVQVEWNEPFTLLFEEWKSDFLAQEKAEEEYLTQESGEQIENKRA